MTTAAYLSRVPEDGEASYDTGHYDVHRDQGEDLELATFVRGAPARKGGFWRSKALDRSRGLRAPRHVSMRRRASIV